MLVDFYQTIRRHMQEDRTIQILYLFESAFSFLRFRLIQFRILTLVYIGLSLCWSSTLRYTKLYKLNGYFVHLREWSHKCHFIRSILPLRLVFRRHTIGVTNRIVKYTANKHDLCILRDKTHSKSCSMVIINCYNSRVFLLLTVDT
jgi:hypothetical protein